MHHLPRIRVIAALVVLGVALSLMGMPGWHGDGRVAEGQSTVTLLDNLSAPAASNATAANIVRVGTVDGTLYKKSGTIETGSNEAGYTLTELTFRIASTDTGLSPGVAIHADDGNGNPAATPTHTFSAPTPLPPISSTLTDITFTAPANATLQKDTQYHVVYTEGSTGSWIIGHSTYNVTSGITAATDWEFPAAGRNQTGTDAWGTLRSSRTPYMKLEGQINVPAGVTVTVPSTPITIAEGSTGTYTIVLDSQPSSNVTITPSSDDDGVTVSGPLTFTSTNWETAQTVTVTAVEDDNAHDVVGATISHTAASSDTGYADFDVDDVTVNVTENDTAGVTVTGSPLTITEGSSDSYMVVLDTQPGDTESVTITPSSANMLVTFNPASVTFDDDDWNQPKTIGVTAIHDDDLVQDSDTITNAVSGLHGIRHWQCSVCVGHDHRRRHGEHSRSRPHRCLSQRAVHRLTRS